MKVKQSELKTANVGYLYADGHLVLVHQKRDSDAGKVEWATIYENVGIRCNFTGRLIIEPGALSFLLHATSIEAKPARVDAGSQKTRDLGIRVGSIILRNGSNTDWWIITTMPDIIMGDIKQQEEVQETFDPEILHWSTMNVKQVYREN